MAHSVMRYSQRVGWSSTRRMGLAPGTVEWLWQRISPCPNTGCWFWDGATDIKGYGCTGVKRTTGAHRLAFMLLRGEIAPDKQLDHLCRVPCCVNPDHLEPVSISENVKRGVGPAMRVAYCKAITSCPQGHEYTPTNTRYSKKRERSCRTCERHRARNRREIRRSRLKCEIVK